MKELRYAGPDKYLPKHVERQPYASWNALATEYTFISPPNNNG